MRVYSVDDIEKATQLQHTEWEHHQHQNAYVVFKLKDCSERGKSSISSISSSGQDKY